MEPRILERNEATRAVAEALRRIPSAEQRLKAAVALIHEVSDRSAGAWDPVRMILPLRDRPRREVSFDDIAHPHYCITDRSEPCDGRIITVGSSESPRADLYVSSRWDCPHVVLVKIEDPVPQKTE